VCPVELALSMLESGASEVPVVELGYVLIVGVDGQAMDTYLPGDVHGDRHREPDQDRRNATPLVGTIDSKPRQ
jgi:hypothetical protein